ncbi:MAG: hypothetical protein GXP53_11820 [Deltaproteobacteria bacterium]|nr:hypothetical protein [Deltaproteobacteria bacterium]
MLLIKPRALPERPARFDRTMSFLGGKRGNPYGVTYCAAKAGLIEWFRGLRLLKNNGDSA